MAIRTIALSSGAGKWTTGWPQLTVTDATPGVWEGPEKTKKFIDLFFDGYPETFRLRVYEAFSKDNEEFAMARFFKVANAGILDELKDANGKSVLQFDDDPENLKGSSFNVLFYKNEEGYMRAWDRIAPVVADTPLKYSAEDVKFWKSNSREAYAKRFGDSLDNSSTSGNSKGDGDDLPF